MVYSMRIKGLIVVLFAFCGYVPLGAQTVVWEMPPMEGVQVKHVTNDVYQVSRHGQNTLFAHGKMVENSSYAQIRGFYEDKALLLDGKRVVGVLTKSGDCHLFEKDYFVLDGLDFFSDGLLAVSTGNVKGYVDEWGREVLGFDSYFDNLELFTEGLAVVKTNGTPALIDKKGNKKTIILPKIGRSITAITNVFQGKAYLWDGRGEAYVYDVNDGTCVKHDQKISDKRLDYLGCLRQVTGREENVPFQKGTQGAIGLRPTKQDDGWGYLMDSHVLLPAQFAYASPFMDGLAVVELDGKIGILKLIDSSEPFAARILDGDTFEYEEGNKVKCSFEVSVPAVWQNEEIEVLVRNKQEGASVTVHKDKYYDFDYRPKGDEGQSFIITVVCNGLKLFSDELTWHFKMKEKPIDIPDSYIPKPDPKKCTHGCKHPASQCSTCSKCLPCPHGCPHTKAECRKCKKKVCRFNK